jgi:hypothetical protein
MIYLFCWWAIGAMILLLQREGGVLDWLAHHPFADFLLFRICFTYFLVPLLWPFFYVLWLIAGLSHGRTIIRTIVVVGGISVISFLWLVCWIAEGVKDDDPYHGQTPRMDYYFESLHDQAVQEEQAEKKRQAKLRSDIRRKSRRRGHGY